MRQFWILILFAAVALGLTGCGDTIKGKTLAQAQIKLFHDRFDAEKYSEIYSAAAAEFRKASGEKKFTELLAAVHRKLGKTISTSTVTWRVNTKNFKTTVVVVQETTFAQGKGTETFNFAVADGVATLLGYNINSTDMMLK